jgi:nitrate/TMAO reductase-like tetraheme cytochrome c subunit
VLGTHGTHREEDAPMNRVGAVTIISLAVAFNAGCTGPDGARGNVGAAGAAGAQGTPGPEGPSGPKGDAIGVDGGTGLPTSCLSPCHGFNGIVEQWKTSTHYATFISNLGEDEVASWTGPAACGNCHAIDAVKSRLDGVNASGGGAVANRSNGELSYRNPTTSALTESTYKGSAKVASVNCITCHAVTNENDPHRTGAAYTEGSFPLRVASGPTDQAFLEKSPDTSAVTGMAVGARGSANTCIFCHKSRKDVTNYITPTNNSFTSANWGPHEGPQADVFTGKGGYEYAGKTYGTSTHEQKLTCVDCHMADSAANDNRADHSFYAKVSTCVGCHAGATSFDIGGDQSQIVASLSELQSVLNTAGYLTRGAAGNPALSASELADKQFALDKTRVGAVGLSGDRAGAVYNYLLVARGSAKGVHNPKYTRQLIFDSIFTITQPTAPTTLVRPL